MRRVSRRSGQSSPAGFLGGVLLSGLLGLSLFPTGLLFAADATGEDLALPGRARDLPATRLPDGQGQAGAAAPGVSGAEPSERSVLRAPSSDSREGIQQGEKPLFLLQTDIVGSLLNPRVPYQIPWRKPESIEKGDVEASRGNLPDLFVPLDPEVFERALRLHQNPMEQTEPPDTLSPLKTLEGR